MQGWLLCAAMLLAGLCLTIWLYQGARERDRATQLVRFREQVTQTTQALAERTRLNEQLLLASVALLQGSDDVSPQEWLEFGESMRLRDRYDGLQGVGLIKPVREAAHEPWRSTIVYVAPGSQAVDLPVNQDLYAVPAYRDAMNLARDTGRTALTVTYGLHTEQGGKRAFALLMPIYKKGWPTDSVDQRRAALDAWVFSPYGMDALMKSLAERVPDLALSVYDGEAAESGKPAFENTLHLTVGGKAAQGDFVESRQIEFGQRVWRIRLATTPLWRATHPFDRATNYLWSGVAITLGWVGMLAALIGHRRRALNLARAMTQTIKASEAKYRMLTEAQNDLISAARPDGTLVYVNAAYAHYFGRTPESFRGTNLYDHVKPEDMASVRCQFERLLEERHVLTMENRIVNERGEMRWLAWTNSIMEDFDGSGELIYSVGRDITERKSLALQVADREQRFRALFEHMQGGFALCEVIVDANGNPSDFRFLESNDVFAQMTGWPKAVTIGKTVMGLMLADHEEMALWVRSFGAVALGKGSLHIERYSKTMKRWLDIVVYQPAPMQFALVILDATARHQAQSALLQREQQMEGIIQTAMDAIITVNAELNVVVFNQAASQMFQVPVAEALGQPLDRFMPAGLHGPHGLKIRAFGSQAQAARRMGNDQQWLAQRANGQTFPIEASVSKVGEGEQTLVTAVIRDVTDLQAAQQARAAQIQAEAASQAKSQFLANMSHEIRTPLNAVLGFARIGWRDTNQLPYKRILDAGRHLLAVVNDILDFSKIEAGKMQVDERPCRLSAVVESAAEMVADRARVKGLNLAVHVAPDLPPWIHVDPMRLEQVLVNLLSNGVKFTEQGQVSLSIKRTQSGLEFEVTDTGIGMTAEQMGRMFRAFEQADQSTTRQFGGTGLGLAISANLARLMGGDIKARSEPGRGAVFTLALPLKEAPAQSEHHHHERQSASWLSGKCIMVVDDVEVNRLILEDLLQHAGARVVCEADGQQALDRLVQLGVSAVDLILMDLQMPVMDGLTATRHVLDLAPGLPVIGLTAHAFEQERARCLAAGMVGHVAKPVEPDILMDAIGEALHLQRDEATVDLAPVSAPAAKVATEASHVDWVALDKLFGKKPGLLARALDSVVSSNAETPARLRAAAAQGDFKTMGFLTHKLRGAAGNIRANGLQQVAKQAEEACATESDQSSELVEQVAQSLEQLLAELMARQEAMA